ncbi:MAG: DASS family sodium-coupled anion symporter [Planctomycetota bacterium]
MTTQGQEPRNLLRLWVCVTIGVALWFCPAPAGLTPQAWRVFAVFAATIVSFLVRPLPMGVCVLIGLLVLGVSGELALVAFIRDLFTPLQDRPPSQLDLRVALLRYKDLLEAYPLEPAERAKLSLQNALSGFADTTTWLVVAAFLLAGAMVRSGLGRRLALTLIGRLGGTTLGLGYGIAAAELVLGPFIPSNTARGGGVMAPIVDSLSHAMNSRADHQPRRAGEYLTLVGAHTNLIAAAMFLTGMAANPLVGKAAGDVLGVTFGWGTWLLGSIVPGLFSLAVLPWLLHRLCRPAASGGAAKQQAREELAGMGPWTAKQIALAAVLAGMLVLWATAPLQKQWLGYALPTTLVALGGVVLLVVLGVERWADVVGNAAAWDTLIWLGGLITMANALRDTGFTGWFAASAGGWVQGWPAVATAVGLAVVYFYSMYAFSMLTGHILAFAGAFFAVGSAAGDGAAGAPPLLLVGLVAYFSNLCGCLTNYSSGPIVIYFGLGYVPAGRWFRVGLLVSLAHLAVWLGVGLPYWKLLGWW